MYHTGASLSELKLLQYNYLNWGTWKNIIQSQRFLKAEDSQVFCKRTNNIDEFVDCFLRGQVSSNSFKVFNGCIVEP